MSNFVQNLLARHTSSAEIVQPRPRGRFEPVSKGMEQRVTPNFGEADVFREERPYPTQPFDTEQPLADTFRPSSTKPYESAEKGDFRTDAALPPLVPLIPSALTVFPEIKDFLPPKLVDKNKQSAPVTIGETVGANGQDASRPYVAKAAVTATVLPGSQGSVSHPIPPVPNRIHPVFDSIEKETPLREGLLNEGGNLQKGGGLGNFAAGNRMSLETGSKQAQPAPVLAGRDKGMTAKMGFSQAQPSPSVIKVNIGRIEVRAVVQASPNLSTTGAKPKAQPRLTLEEYLKRQNSSQR